MKNDYKCPCHTANEIFARFEGSSGYNSAKRVGRYRVRGKGLAHLQPSQSQ